MSIKVSSVTKKYESQLALNDISFEIGKGEIVGFLGPNGAGKSTMMKILTGYITPTSGKAFIDTIEVDSKKTLTKEKVGYLPELNPLYDEMYVKEYLNFIATVHKVSKTEVTKVIDRVGLTPESSKKIHQLSKGYKQRVGLAAAIIHNPEVLILDEPTTGLDPNQLIGIRDLIKELGREKTVLFSTHIMQEVEAVCDRVIIINKGELVLDASLASLKEGQEQVIEVEFDYRVEEQFVQRIEGLKAWKNGFDTKWTLTFENDNDNRGLVFDFAQENGLKILKMDTQNKSLEKLFSDLTT